MEVGVVLKMTGSLTSSLQSPVPMAHCHTNTAAIPSPPEVSVKRTLVHGHGV